MGGTISPPRWLVWMWVMVAYSGWSFRSGMGITFRYFTSLSWTLRMVIWCQLGLMGPLRCL